MDIKFHVDDFEDIQDVIDFLNDQDTDDVQYLFEFSSRDWEFKAA